MDVSKFSLKGKVAIVVGGAGDIGHAIAITMANAGADIVVASRKLENLEKVAAEIKATGRKSLAIASHVAKIEDSKNLLKQVMAELNELLECMRKIDANFVIVSNEVGLMVVELDGEW